MGLEVSPGTVEPNLGSLYCLDTEGKLSKRVSPVSISNGLAWTSDDCVMYYIDSIPKKVYAFDYDKNTGDICEYKFLCNFSPQ